MDIKWLSFVAPALLTTGLVLGGCGSSDDDDEDEDCGSSCEPGPQTLNLAGSWLAQSSFRAQDDEPGVGSTDIPDAVRKEVFILVGDGTPQIYGCRDGEVVNATREGDDTLSFDYLGIHYELDIVNANTMSGSMDGEFTCDSCAHTETETGKVSFKKIRTSARSLGTLDYTLDAQFNDEIGSVEVTCFVDEHVQGIWQEVSGRQVEFRADQLGLGFSNSGNPTQTDGLRGQHDRALNDATGGSREFAIQLLDGVRFDAEADGKDGDLQFAFTTTYTDEGVTININSSGTGTDASGDAFVFDFHGAAQLDLSSADASSDAL